MVYIDSSMQVAAYVIDLHSAEVAHRMSLKPHVCLTPFNRSELANAIYRQVFLKRLSTASAQQAWESFEEDCRHGIWDCIEFPHRAWETCANLALRFGPTLGVRMLDSLHVACALELKAQRFWTFDERQSRLAEAVGLDMSA